jgi:Zn-dependent protease
MKFYKQEIIDIIIACFILTLSFGIASRFIGPFEMLLLFIIIVPAFLLHELAHKFVAQYYGYLAIFIKFDYGLLLALVTSIFGFVFAAPGAVFIQNARDKHILPISIAGPITNIILSITGLILLMPVYPAIGLLFTRINAYLAIFNLLPFPPLDGFKIFSSNKIIWLITLLIAIAIFIIAG